MPNHCENDLYIESENLEQLLEFKEYAKGNGYHGNKESLLDEHKFIPYPEEFLKQDKLVNKLREEGIDNITGVKDGYNSGGYEWCIQNWGTKWGNYDVSIVDEDIEENKWNQYFIKYTFRTAWSPSTPVTLAMSKMFPELHFYHTYFECGCAFNGMFEVKGGEVLADQTGDYFGDRGG